MTEILDLCREYGQPPGWWAGMDRGDRALLIADRRNRVKAHNAAIERQRRETGTAKRRR